MPDFDGVIAKIDGYIKELIKRMVEARLKRIEASKKILSVMDQYMSKRSYQFRLGDVYDPFVKVESDRIKHADVKRPTIKLNYVKPAINLQYNGETIPVPEIPDFIFETWTPTEPAYNPEQFQSDAMFEYLKKSVVFRFPLDANVEEPPNFQDAFSKYYYPDEWSKGASALTYTWSEPVNLTWHDSFLSANEFTARYRISGVKVVTIQGTQYELAFLIFTGITRFTQWGVGGTAWIQSDPVYFPSLLCEFTTNTDQVEACVFLGKAIPRGTTEDNGWYYRNALIAVAGNQLLFADGEWFRTFMG